MNTWLNRGASGGLAGAEDIRETLKSALAQPASNTKILTAPLPASQPALTRPLTCHFRGYQSLNLDTPYRREKYELRTVFAVVSVETHLETVSK